MSHFSSSNGYSKRRTSQAGGIFYETMALFMCSRADRGQHGGGSRCGIDTEHCFNTVAAAVAGDDCFFIGVYAKRPLTAAVQQPAEQYDIPTLVLLDENMKVIRDDIDGACGAVSTPHFTNGLMPILCGLVPKKEQSATKRTV